MENIFKVLPVFFLILVITFAQHGRCHFFRQHGDKVADHLNGLRDTLKNIDTNIKASMEQVRTNMANGIQRSHLTLGSLVGLQRVPSNYQHVQPQPQPQSKPQPQPHHIFESVTENDHRYENLLEVTESIINPHENFDVRSSFVRSDEDLMNIEVSNTPKNIGFGRAGTTNTPPTVIESDTNKIWV